MRLEEKIVMPEDPSIGEPVHRIGRFLVWSTTGAAPSLRVAHSDAPTRIIWDGAVPGGFLQAGTAETKIKENTTPASGFTISDRNLVRYGAQTIDSAEMDDGALVLSGKLRSNRGSTSRYVMTWSAVGDRGVGRGMPVITQLIALQLGPRSAGNWATTEVSVPQYISSRNRSLLLEDTEYSVFDLRRPDVVEIEQFAGS